MARNFKELSFSASYNSDSDDVLNQFYIPVISMASKYDRLAGFFSSTSFAIAAKGLKDFVLKNGHMRLIVNKILEREDVDIIKRVYLDDDYATQYLENDFCSWNIENEIVKDHVGALGWMLKKELLEIKIAFSFGGGLVHQKIGVLEDNYGNRISFSGSINETGQGWLNNLEEFKVFRSWREEETKYLNSDINHFEMFWQDRASRAKIIDAPLAVREGLINIAPQSLDNLNLDSGKLENYLKQFSSSKNDESANSIQLRPYQKKAIDAWLRNNYKGIFEMATGSGKTITSLKAVEQVAQNTNNYFLIIVVPYKHLSEQWAKDVAKLLTNSQILQANSDSRDWRSKYKNLLIDFADEFINEVVVITSYDAFSSDYFLGLFKDNYADDRTYILVADEVHNAGSFSRQRGLTDLIKMRLGLSATPARWFDEEGTKVVLKYFDGTIFQYGLDQAIKDGYLVSYDYYPEFVELTEEEISKYIDITAKINRAYKGRKMSEDEYLRMLAIKRSKIVKNSTNKLTAFEKLVERLKRENKVDHLLVYCDSGGQLEKVQKLLNRFGIINHKFTNRESAKVRDELLQNFDNGYYDCLVAMKCLDEGVNVPSTETAVILASSTNPREYIQRRGRVLRKHPSKEKAIIYDFTVIPSSLSESNQDLRALERKIFKKELLRISNFLETASNKANVLAHISDYMLKYGVFLD